MSVIFTWNRYIYGIVLFKCKTIIVICGFIIKILRIQYLRNRSALAVNCWVIIHCLEVTCKEDQIMSPKREWFIFVQLTGKQWIITQQFTHWSWSISIGTHNKRREHIWSLQLLQSPTFRHCNEELPPILRLRRICLHIFVTSFKSKNDATPSNTMYDVISTLSKLWIIVWYITLFSHWHYRRGVLDMKYVINLTSVTTVHGLDNQKWIWARIWQKDPSSILSKF